MGDHSGSKWSDLYREVVCVACHWIIIYTHTYIHTCTHVYVIIPGLTYPYIFFLSHTGYNRRLMRSTTLSSHSSWSFVRPRTRCNIFSGPRHHWSRTYPSRTTPSTLTMIAAWECARPSQWRLMLPPINNRAPRSRNHQHRTRTHHFQISTNDSNEWLKNGMVGSVLMWDYRVGHVERKGTKQTPRVLIVFKKETKIKQSGLHYIKKFKKLMISIRSMSIMSRCD